MFKRFLFIVMMMVGIACQGDLLYWMIDDTATIDNYPILTWENGRIPDGDLKDSWYAGRIKVLNAQNDETILNIFDPRLFGNAWPGDLDDNWGYWGTGILVSDFRDAADLMFVAEIGHVNNLEWTTIAQTDPIAQEALDAFIRTSLFSALPRIWAPTDFHTVPEPTSVPLAILGIGALALRRKKSEA